MIKIGRRALGLYIALGLVAGVLDLLVFGQALVHALVFGLLVLTTAGLSDHLVGRTTVAAVAALTITVWPLIHHAPVAWLGLAMVPAALLLVPSYGRRWDALALTVIAALSAYAMAQSLYPAVAGGLLAGVLSLLRPRHPTRDQIRLLRSSALLLPGVGLFAAVGVALGLGLPALSVRATLWLAVTLAGFLGLVSLAGLGVSTLLESTDDLQAPAWQSSMLATAVVLSGLAAWLPRVAWAGLEVVAVAAVPVASMAGIASARLHTHLEGRMTLFAWLTPFLAVVQTGV